MFISINGYMVNTDKVKDARAIGSNLYLYFNDGSFSKTVYCRSSSEAESAVEKIAAAKNNSSPAVSSASVSRVYLSGNTTAERIDSVDRSMAALAEKKRQLQEQQAYEEGCEALAALLVGGVSAIAESISRRRDAKKRK